MQRPRGGEQVYRALVAQWKAQQAAKRPKTAKLVNNDRLREYVQERLDGSVRRPDGTIVTEHLDVLLAFYDYPAERPSRSARAGVKTALRDLARRWKQLDDEIKTLHKHIDALVRVAAPELVELHGVGVEIAGQFLVTAGDNAERIHSEAAFAKLC
jgi:transposase